MFERKKDRFPFLPAPSTPELTTTTFITIFLSSLQFYIYYIPEKYSLWHQNS